MNTPSSSAASAYLQQEIATASPEKLVLMCYDGAVKFLSRAKVRLERGDLPGWTHSIGRAQAIISEMNATLNIEKGGEVGTNLRSLYLFLNRYLVEASQEQDIEKVDRSIAMIQDLRAAWAEAAGLPASDEVL